MIFFLYFSYLHCACATMLGIPNTPNFYYEQSPRGNPILVLHYNRYVRNRESSKRTFWRCTKYYQNSVRCPGSVAISKNTNQTGAHHINTSRAHNELCEIRRNADMLRPAKQNDRPHIGQQSSQNQSATANAMQHFAWNNNEINTNSEWWQCRASTSSISHHAIYI